MKKFLIISIILLMGIPGFAKAKKDFVLQLGVAQNDITKNIGKPDIVTRDSDNILTWVYVDVKKLPASNVKKSESIKKLNENTILTIKFDENDKISGYSYMTTYIGEKDD